jgi:dihydrofolate reductase
MTCSVFIATSLDGFIARTDGSIDWLEAVQVEGEDYGYATFFASVDVVVMGKNTWQTVLGFDEWPYAGKRVIVLTHTPGAAKHGEVFFSGDVRELDLEHQHVYVDGGDVIRQFLATGLVDQLTVSLIPVVLGTGRALFAGGVEQKLQLVDTTAFASGLVQLRYALPGTSR